MRLLWDEPKRLRNLLPSPQGHGLDFADARDGFDLDAAVLIPGHPGQDGRPRLVALGPLDGRLVAAVISPLGTEAVARVSLRPASIKERGAYDQSQA